MWRIGRESSLGKVTSAQPMENEAIQPVREQARGDALWRKRGDGGVMAWLC